MCICVLIKSKKSLIFHSLLGVYLSRYADLLQANPLEAGAVGDVVIFKIMKVISTSAYHISKTILLEF